MSEVELHKRYPMSRTEDITDAYLRGFQACIAIAYDPLGEENARLRKELEMEREDNASIRRLFDAVAPRCGKPDCPSLVAYVNKLRELVRDMWFWGYEGHMDSESQEWQMKHIDGVLDRMCELGIEGA